jgi:hypothetical protein
VIGITSRNEFYEFSSQTTIMDFSSHSRKNENSLKPSKFTYQTPNMNVFTKQFSEFLSDVIWREAMTHISAEELQKYLNIALLDTAKYGSDDVESDAVDESALDAFEAMVENYKNDEDDEDDEDDDDKTEIYEPASPSPVPDASPILVTPCPYGARCYRQHNPKHTSEFSHPTPSPVSSPTPSPVSSPVSSPSPASSPAIPISSMTEFSPLASLSSPSPVRSSAPSPNTPTPPTPSVSSTVPPPAPKKARSAYLLFCADKREDVKKKNPDLKPSEIMSKLGRLWMELDDSEKKEWKKKEREEKLMFYNKSLPAYSRNPILRYDATNTFVIFDNTVIAFDVEEDGHILSLSVKDKDYINGEDLQCGITSDLLQLQKLCKAKTVNGVDYNSPINKPLDNCVCHGCDICLSFLPEEVEDEMNGDTNSTIRDNCPEIPQSLTEAEKHAYLDEEMDMYLNYWCDDRGLDHDDTLSVRARYFRDKEYEMWVKA